MQEARVKAWSSLLKAVVPVVCEPDGTYKILYYAQPETEKGAGKVPMMPVFGGWAETPLYLHNKLIEYVICGAVLDKSYREAPYANQRQISNIQRDVRASLKRAHGKEFGQSGVAMLPLTDVIGMKQDGVK